MAMAAIFSIFILVISLFSLGNSLNSNYYDKTCPNVESLVTAAVKKAVANDQTVPAALLRMHFHDCFIRVYIYIASFCFLTLSLQIINNGSELTNMLACFRDVMLLCC